MPRALRLVLALALLLPFSGALRAQADDPAPEDPKRKTYEGKVKDARKKAASKHSDLGEWLYGKKLYAESIPEYERALSYDADHSKARERMGFVKKEGGGWNADPKKAPKRKSECPEEKKYAYLDEFANKVKKEGHELAEVFWSLGDWCKKNGFAAEAEDACRMCIDHERDHAKAREALGFKKDSGGAWVGASDRAEKDAMGKKAASASEGRPIQKATADDKAIGATLTKRESAHFFFQTSSPDKLLAECVRLAETTREEFYTQFEIPADRVLVEGLVWGILLTKQAEYHAWIDQMVDGSQGNRDQLKRTGGHLKHEPPQYIGYHDDENSTKDFVVHYTIHVLHHYYMNPAAGAMQPWLYEGTGHYFSHRLLRTGLTNCFTQATGDTSKKGVPRDSDWWKQFIREAVVGGRDPEMRILMTAGINQLDGEMLVKAWSVIEWLMGTKRSEMLAFHEALKSTDGKAESQESALKAAFGAGYIELDQAWREYVRKSY